MQAYSLLLFPIPLNTNQYQVILTQHHLVPTVPSYTDPIPPNTKQYRLLLTQYHHIWTSSTLYWSGTTKYQPVPPSTNQYCCKLNQYSQAPTGTDTVPSYMNYPVTNQVPPTWWHQVLFHWEKKRLIIRPRTLSRGWGGPERKTMSAH